jgi:molecular chaperone DnaK
LPGTDGLPDTGTVVPSRRLAAVLVLAAASLTGCGASSPSSGPTTPGASGRATPALPTPPVAGLSWTKAIDVARPDDAFAQPSALPTGPSGPGTAGHPGHFPGQAIVDDVAWSGGRLAAVGYVGLGGTWTAIGWTSTDAQHWQLTSIDRTPGSLAVAVAAIPATGGFIAGGRVDRTPAMWTSPDGTTWDRRPVPTLSAGAEWERVTTVLPTAGGIVAGGSVGPELGDRRARFWWSADGTTWSAVPDDPAFAGAEVADILEVDGRFVAIGKLGTGQRWSGSIAWMSSDGRTWKRIDSPELRVGIASALAVAPGGGLVAVGSDLDEREALAWHSTDGSTWQAAPREDSRLYNGEKIRMTDVMAVRGGLVAVGNYVGVQYGTATSWISKDGLSWRRAADYAALGQGEMLAVGQGGPGLVAVGSFGAPDNYIPTIWLTAEP